VACWALSAWSAIAFRTFLSALPARIPLKSLRKSWNPPCPAHGELSRRLSRWRRICESDNRVGQSCGQILPWSMWQWGHGWPEKGASTEFAGSGRTGCDARVSLPNGHWPAGWNDRQSGQFSRGIWPSGLTRGCWVMLPLACCPAPTKFGCKAGCPTWPCASCGDGPPLCGAG
jgi:hypothetical protein